MDSILTGDKLTVALFNDVDELDVFFPLKYIQIIVKYKSVKLLNKIILTWFLNHIVCLGMLENEASALSFKVRYFLYLLGLLLAITLYFVTIFDKDQEK